MGARCVTVHGRVVSRVDGTCAQLCVGGLRALLVWIQPALPRTTRSGLPRELSEETYPTCAIQRVAYERPTGFNALFRAQLVTRISKSADKVLKKENRR